jgi:hypothetical protein
MKRTKKSLKIPESVDLRTDNTMANIKMTNNALQNIIYTTRTQLQNGVNEGASEG